MIDLYCERTGPGFWTEPFNVLSNAAYLVAAWALVRHARNQTAPSDPQAHLLAYLPIAIAAGSALFHLMATPLARRLDEAPILAFELLFLWMYVRRALGWTSASAAAALVALTIAVAAGRLAPWLNGSVAYLPALAACAAIAVQRHRITGRLDLVAATAVFALAIGCRMADLALCAAFPTGTHFVWHLLTAVVLYAFGRTVLSRHRGSEISHC